MSVLDLCAFNEIEKKYDLLNAEIEGYHFWVYLRAELAGSYVRRRNHLMAAPHNPQKESISARIKVDLVKAKNILKRGKIPKVPCDILVLNHPRRVLVDGLYECIYTDSILEKIEKAVVLEEPYMNNHYMPAKTKNMIYTDIIELNSYLYCVVQNYLNAERYKRNKDVMIEAIRKPIEELNRICGVEISAEEFGDSLIYGLYMYKAERAYYKKVIFKLRPKVIMEVVSYNRKCMVVNELAAEMGIPTIELQHGTVGEEHIAYNYPEGYEIKQFPAYIFMFSDYWKYKSRFPVDKKKLIAVGYPFLERMAQKFEQRSKAPRNKKNILFLSSDPIGDKLTQIALTLQQLLDGRGYNIIFKLHPKEYAVWKERYPNLQGSNIEVIDNSKINLYELYAISDYQVSGFNSTTIFEGLFFSLETYILDYCVSKEIADLHEQGIVRYFNTAEDLADRIGENESRNSFAKEELWKKNSLQNIINELTRIMGEKAWMEKNEDK